MSIQFQSRDRRQNYKSYYRREKEKQKGRSGVVVGHWRSKPATRFNLSIRYHREETRNCRSEWCSGRALSFKTIGRGFAPRNCFVFSFIRRRRRVSIYQSYIGGLPPASALSFSHADVGDALQFINHISLLYTLYMIEKKCVSIALARATRKLVGFHMK